MNQKRIDHKEYLILRELAGKHFGITNDDTQFMKDLVNVVEQFHEIRFPMLVKRIADLRNIIKKRTVPNGMIAVSRDGLKNHLLAVKSSLQEIDTIMTTEESDFKRGQRVAQEWGKLNYTTDSLLHFELKMPFDEIKKLLK